MIPTSTPSSAAASLIGMSIAQPLLGVVPDDVDGDPLVDFDSGRAWTACSTWRRARRVGGLLGVAAGAGRVGRVVDVDVPLRAAVRARGLALRRGAGLRRAAAVGLVEAVALERHADRLEDLLDRHRGAGARMDGFGQGVVGERLLDLDRLAGVEELVDVGWHPAKKISSPPCRYAVRSFRPPAWARASCPPPRPCRRS